MRNLGGGTGRTSAALAEAAAFVGSVGISQVLCAMYMCYDRTQNCSRGCSRGRTRRKKETRAASQGSAGALVLAHASASGMTGEHGLLSVFLGLLAWMGGVRALRHTHTYLGARSGQPIAHSSCVARHIQTA